MDNKNVPRGTFLKVSYKFLIIFYDGYENEDIRETIELHHAGERGVYKKTER